MRLLILPKSHVISAIRPELHSRGVVFIAEDQRHQYQMIGQTSTSIIHAMEHLCNEKHSKSVVCDIASRGASTGSFRILKMPFHEAVPYLQSKRPSFEKQVVSTRVPTLYKVSAA